jgi:hypothetical protein
MHDESPTSIMEIACAWAGDLFATAEAGSRVEIWSLSARLRVASFETIFDVGGRRLGFSWESVPKVVAGAFNRYGVRAYDPLSGEEIWRRAELKQVQFVAGTPYGVAVGVERGPLRLLESATGEPRCSLRGVSELYAGEHGLALAVGVAGSERISIVDLADEGRPVWRGRIDGFAVLDAAVGADAVAIAEAGGIVRCLDGAGGERWVWKAARGEHVRRVVWLPDGRLAGILKPYESGTARTMLVLYAVDGAAVESIAIPDSFEFAFSAGGAHLLAAALDGETSSTGIVIDVPSTRPRWTFRPPAPFRAIGR